MLRGKCRYCHKKIDDNPLVELSVGVYFVASYLLWPAMINSTYAWFDFSLWLLYGVGLAILFVYDLRWYLLPDRVVWPLAVLAGIDFIARSISLHLSPSQFFVELALSLFVISGFYYALHLLSKGRWVGLGDVKLGIFMGLALGWQAAVMALLLANLIGCLVVIPGLFSGKLRHDSQVPFGPFLIVAFIIAGLWGPQLVQWYSSLLV